MISPMKILLTAVTLLWTLTALAADETADPKQTPDVVSESEAPPVPDPAEARTPSSQLDNALLENAYKGNLADVEILVAKGAAVNLQDKKGRTPTILAASNGHTEVVEFLIAHGANVNARDGDGQTALMYAAKRSFNETAALLLKSGAEVNVQSRKKGITALILAAGWGNEELVRTLLEHGADPTITDNFGRTAKYYAEKMGGTVVASLLPDAPKRQ